MSEPERGLPPRALSRPLSPGTRGRGGRAAQKPGRLAFLSRQVRQQSRRPAALRRDARLGDGEGDFCSASASSAASRSAESPCRNSWDRTHSAERRGGRELKTLPHAGDNRARKKGKRTEKVTVGLGGWPHIQQVHIGSTRSAQPTRQAHLHTCTYARLLLRTLILFLRPASTNSGRCGALGAVCWPAPPGRGCRVVAPAHAVGFL